MKKTTPRFSILVLFALLTSFLTIKAQTTISIGSGTGTNSTTSYPAPYGNYYWGAKHQILIKASELTSAGMAAGNISKLAFNVAAPGGAPLSGFTIKIAATTATVLTTTFVSSGFTTVFGPQTYTDIAGWNTHTFSTPFYWNGTSNLIIETCFDNSAWTTNAQMYFSTTAFNSVTFYDQDAATVCSNTIGTTSLNRPNIRLTYAQANVPPTVIFKANKTFSCNGSVNFTDSSCCNVTSWSWNFGDGNTSTLQNPSHTYSTSGTYTVSLIATNSYGSTTLVKNNYITISLGGGPVAASCAPSTTAYCCGFGITNVTFSTINNTTQDASDGYQDYSCSSGTTVYAGYVYSISVNTPQPAPHNVMAWIDYDNNGVFDTITELIFSSVSTTNASGSVTIPASAVVNTPLRMRVSADYEANPIPSPCGNLQYGQAEDYSVTIIANTNPPVANFTATPTTSCSGNINFTDNSTNIPTSWTWNFGDGNTSSLQNPTHLYSSNGIYNVTLIATNAYGIDTIVKNNYIHITVGNTPISASCTPPTTGYCCGYGIYNVTLNTINNNSASGIDGYQDYTCAQQTTLTQGNSYSISIQTSSANEQDTRVWIDLNNNGIFENAELLFSSSNTFNPSGTITINSGSVFNTPLRMRVFSDYAGSNPSSCTNASYGQVEDYTVIVVPNTNPPIALFSANKFSTCDGIIIFSDSSKTVPTSWLWNFGDGTTSTLQNPTHTYTSIGVYTVTLIATNAYGSDTLTKANYINVASTTGGPIAATCTPTTTGYCCGMGIYNVTFNSINNITADGSDGYKDYSCVQQTSVVAGQSYSISVRTGTQYSENVKVWIDYNNDGVFNTTNEQVLAISALQNHNGNIVIPTTASLNTPLRMRVASDYNAVAPCTNVTYGQVEDYLINILPNTTPPVTAFTANVTSSCNGIITFANTSSNATSFSWNFGDGTTSTQQNPTHTYTANGTYSVSLISCNAYGCDTLVKTNYLYINLGGPITASCSPITTSYCCGMGIYNVTFNSINNTTSDGIDSYQDYSCSQQAILTAGQSYSISIRTGTQYSEYVKVWIDFNNDGSFNTTNEQVFSDNLMQTHTGTITIPGGVILNTSLRMRVTSDYNTIAPCTNVMYGQVEDYAVTIVPNTNPPVANFVANTTSINPGGTVTFTDLSSSLPTNWQWTFTGGTPTSSTVQNPAVVYNTLGTYPVKLRVSNAYGADSITKTAYINVVNSINMCSSTTTSLANGVLFDSGGPTGNYGLNENCSLLIDPGCATSITLNFSSFYTESYYDYLRVYNGTNATSPLLLNASGASLPASVTANSGKMFIVFTSNYSTVYAGFQANWTSVLSSVPPVASFSMSNNNPPAGTAVNFTDLSTNTPVSWYWNFGNGDTSTVQNPSYIYTTVGTYTVTLIAKKCSLSDTITQTITVQAGPDININPTSFNVTLTSCHDSITLPMVISNLGSNYLNYNIDGGGYGLVGDSSVLVIQDATPWTTNMSTFLISNFGITPTVITSNQIATANFSLYDLIITTGGQSTAYYTEITNNKTKFETFVNSGGILLYQLATMGATADMVNGASITYLAASQNDVVMTSHPIVAGIPAAITGNSASHTYFNNLPAGTQIITTTTNASQPTTAEYDYGQGKVIATGMTWEWLANQTGNSAKLLLFNGVKYCLSLIKTTPGWLSVSSFSDSVTAGDSSIVYFTFHNNGLSGGQYTTNLIINSNDPLSPSITVPCTLNIPLTPCVSFSTPYTTICNGNINFTNTSISGTSWNWDFGDGTYSTQQNPTHTFTANGTYTITLIACNAYGCDTLVKTNYINVTLGGPIAASCSPTTTGYCCGMGIYNVAFNTINNTTADGSDGYKDYSCTQQTNVIAGQSYSISVKTGTQYAENVTVWIDYNNDGVFNTSNEQVFYNNAMQNHTGNIVIPASASLNTPLRMRVASDYNTIVLCNNVTYGQVEDYTINIQPNTVPPVADFNANTTTSCNGIITFVNTTTNATSFSWNFGDGTYSTQQTPTHTYTANGTYSVSLIACNPYGCDTIVKTNYINVTLGGPIAASCSPATTSYCCGMGIYNVAFNTINNSTADGSDGYKDYSCTQQTTVIAGQSYSISVTTGTQYSENVTVWIDYNNDGVFNTSNEQVFYNYGMQNHTGNIVIPASASLNTPLRMRIASDYNTIVLCNNVTYGQVEDYTVNIQPNTVPPVADFNANTTTSCNGIITFVNTTINATSFSWDFGDGTYSTQQTPTHTYTANGTYSVSLIACNSYGCDTIVKTNYINITLGGPIAASCSPATTGYCCGMGIYTVSFNTINNSTADGSDGYKDYSCTQQTTVIAGQSYSIFVKTGTQYSENITVWIDYNNDGVFNTSNEQVFYNYGMQNHTGNIAIPSSASLNTPLRMRIASDYNTIVLCNNVTYGQVEDYTVNIQPNTVPPVADFTANITTVNIGGTVGFTDLSTNSPTTWQWSFPGGTPSSSTSQNPSIIYNTPGIYPVALTVSNNYGSDAITKINYITVTNEINLCSGAISTSASDGNLFDSGGSAGNYGVSENCSFLIEPTCADFVKLTFTAFATENGFDKLNVYNGINSSAPLLLSASGNTIPAAVTANSGKMFITFTSDGSVTDQGFAANWTSISNSAVTASFIAADTISKDSIEIFTNTSTGNFTSLWDFGDGATSTLTNPTHIYTYPGYFLVTLSVTDTASGCTFSTTKLITVVWGTTVNDLNSNSQLNVYPNPSNELINIYYIFNGKQTLNISLFNLLGEKVYTDLQTPISEYRKTLEVTSYPAGIYILRIVSGQEQISRVINIVH